MGCTSCSTGGGGTPKGCKSNGSCSSGGCNKLNVYDWLKDMAQPVDYKPFNIVEVRFKGSRKEFFKNDSDSVLYTGDYVVVEADNGYDIGTVSLSGELVRLHLKKYGVDENSNRMKKIYRVASERDVQKWEELRALEYQILEKARTHALEMNLKMKLSDNEYQADGKKIIFFYTAEERVDFRELIKKYADEFKVRIEMRQIGYRQEAARLGGIGSCGRELCCSTWLTDFKTVSTSSARYQNLSINMLKLSGQCGRLKCCLNYELDTYMEAMADFPGDEKVRLETENGTARVQKVDILRRMMWFSVSDASDWVMLPVERVNAIIEMNKAGQKPPALLEKVEADFISSKMPAVEDLFTQDSLTRLDEKKKKKKKRKNPKKKTEGGGPTPVSTGPVTTTPAESKPKPKPQENRHPQGPRPPKHGDNRPQNRPQNPNKPGGQNNPNRENKPGGQNNPNRESNPNKENNPNRTNRPNNPNNPGNENNRSNRPNRPNRPSGPNRPPDQRNKPPQDNGDKKQ